MEQNIAQIKKNKKKNYTPWELPVHTSSIFVTCLLSKQNNCCSCLFMMQCFIMISLLLFLVTPVDIYTSVEFTVNPKFSKQNTIFITCFSSKIWWILIFFLPYWYYTNWDFSSSNCNAASPRLSIIRGWNFGSPPPFTRTTIKMNLRNVQKTAGGWHILWLVPTEHYSSRNTL